MDELEIEDKVIFSAYIIGGIICLLIGGLSGFIVGFTIYLRNEDNINAPIAGILFGVILSSFVHAIGEAISN